VIESSVTVRDPVAETNSAAHFFGQVTIDRSVVGEDIEGGSGIISGSPPDLGNPVSRQIDTFLDR
jgi:hypothetical protein